MKVILFIMNAILFLILFFWIERPVRARIFILFTIILFIPITKGSC